MYYAQQASEVFHPQRDGEKDPDLIYVTFINDGILVYFFANKYILDDMKTDCSVIIILFIILGCLMYTIVKFPIHSFSNNVIYKLILMT